MSSRECPVYTPFSENIHWVTSVEINQRDLDKTSYLDITVHSIPDPEELGMKKSFSFFLNQEQGVEFKGFTLNDPASR